MFKWEIYNEELMKFCNKVEKQFNENRNVTLNINNTIFLNSEHDEIKIWISAGERDSDEMEIEVMNIKTGEYIYINMNLCAIYEMKFINEKGESEVI